MNKDPEQPASGTGEYKEDIVIPVIEEEVIADAVAVKTGSVRVDKHVETRTRTFEAPLLHEEVEIRRVPVNRVVSQVPEMRKKGDTVIVPVVEEELVVTKRLVLKEEIHMIRHRKKERVVKEVQFDRERAEVHRLDASGKIVDTTAKPAARPQQRRRGLLE